MALTELKRQESVANVLKRLREKADLTTRQAAGIIGVTHTTISQYENGKREFSSLRIEQLVKAYGYTMDQFEKILGHKSVISYKDDCHTLIDRLDDDQLAAVRSILSQLLRQPQTQTVAARASEEDQAVVMTA
ncbi:MAG: helix-turn-helix domain-containing protein [Bdellovibrionaceae bacterium]|nr:helix-turn-helix domain-containing protein [Pseudobdellovibrionaceae bacterium]